MGCKNGSCKLQHPAVWPACYTPLDLQSRQHRSRISLPAHHTAAAPLVLNLQRDNWLPLLGGECVVQHLTRKKRFAAQRREGLECKLLCLKGKGTRGEKSRRSWRQQMNWQHKGNCNAKLRGRLALVS